mgnify:CR=1 FL=1
MRTFKLAAVASTALVGSLLAATGAFAQSTGTTEVEEIEIISTAGQPSIDGVITAETAPKAKASIDQEFISTQASGQTVIQTLNLTPGLNFTNSDPYGSSGGNLRIRGFDGNRISLTFDGIPLNDTGNYAIYTNQQLDPELVARASVNMGTTDVDSPTASATGGTINYTSLKPSTEFGGRASASVGSYAYGRVFGLIETGEFTPFGTTAWFSASQQKYDKFKGPGDLKKWQVNAKVYQPIGDNGDFVSLAVHYNENRNDFYRTTTIANFETFGRGYDNLSRCTRDPATPGVADNDNFTTAPAAPFGVPAGAVIGQNYNPGLDNGRAPADNPAYTGSCTNFYGLRINPSNTGNIRGQSKFTIIPDRLTFTLDSAVQYTLANGGGSTTITENSALVRGSSALAGVDYNGDGDVLDTVRVYAPNTTNTRRYTTLGSLIWDVNDNNTVRLSYTYDYGDHRQTGHYGYLTRRGEPQNVFGGKDGNGRKVLGADGYALRTRDRQSFASLNQISLEYRGRFFDDALQVNIGLRAPTFERDLNQFCLSQRGSTTVLCTTQPTYAADLDTATPGIQSNPNVVALVPAGTGTQYIVPYKRSVSYDAVLPNVGVSFRFLENHTIFASYAEGLSAPRTDNLYTVGFDTVTNRVTYADVEPETSKAIDLGYRFRSPAFIVSTAVWYNTFENRIVSSFDPDLGFNVDRNVGTVDLWGFDAQAGWTPNEKFSLYGSLTYTHSELQDNLILSATTELPIKGKQLVETPEWMAGLRAQYNITEALSIGGQAKYVGKRFTTDVNDEETPEYTVVDFDIRYDLPFFGDKGSYVQFNVTNAFDEKYYGNISSGTNNLTIPDVNPGPAVTPRTPNTAFVSIGAPRTFQATLNVRF